MKFALGCIATLFLCCVSSKRISTLFSTADPVHHKIFTYDQLDGLPEPVQRYFKYALPNGRPYLNFLRLQHTGTFKTGMDKDWTDIRGEQYFTAKPPGFVWIGKTKQFKARDAYVNNVGNLSVYLFGLVRIINSSGEAVDQAELVRWLGEGVWMPTNLLPDEHKQWSAIDDNSAELTFNWKGHSIHFHIHFNELGQIVRLETQRYMEKKLENWVGEVGDYKEIDGIKVPTHIEAGWVLDKGRYTYARFHVGTFEYDIPQKFSSFSENK